MSAARRRWSGGIGGAVAIVVAAVLSGCVTIPTTGPVDAHSIERDADDPGVTFIPAKPVKGASQEDILGGFIAAGTGVSNRFEVARDFLTTKLAARWNPNASVTVTDATQRQVVRTGDDSVSLTVQTKARVDATGLYTGLTSITPTTLEYRFTKVKGEWRISSAPDGIVLTPTSFGTIFGAYPLYFPDPSGQFLVPDLRWFPSGATAPERIVRALIAGPSPWLDGAVVTGFPKDEQLGTDGVTLAGGLATVDLSDDVLSQSDTAKSRMVAQLTSSLAALGSPRVELTAKGFPVATPSLSAADDDPSVAAAPVAVRGDAIGQLGASTLHPFSGLSAALAPVKATAATLDRSQSTLAALGAAGVSRVPASGSAVVVDRRSDLLRPSIDASGHIWSMTSDAASILVFDPKGQSHPVVSSSSATMTVRRMLLSRDGSRLVLGVDTPQGPALKVAGVIRDAQLVPTGLGPWITVPLDSGSRVIDIAWSDPVTVAVLVDTGSGVEVLSQQLAGRSTSLGSPPSGVQVVGGNEGSDALRVLASDGGVLQQTNAGGWQASGPDVSFLVPQQ